jgi:serine/threonine-protein kinase
VLYALLAGRPPFAGRTIVEVINALQNERPLPIRRLAPDTPEAFEDILEQLLEKDPQKRIPTALALANRLKSMEHALSLETRVGPLLQEADDIASPPEPSTRPPSTKTTPIDRASGKTAALEKASSATAPLDPADGNGTRSGPGDVPTLVTSVGSSARSRTAMGTQAGKATGSVHARSTEAAEAAGSSGSTIAGPAPKATRFTTVSEDELRGHREADDASLKQWLIVGALAAVAAIAIGTTVFLATRPPAADELYRAVKQATDANGIEALAGVEDELARFASLYGDDPRAAEMKALQEELALYRLERSFERRAKRGGGGVGLQPVERAYLEAVQLAAAHPEAALAKFDAIVAVFGGPPDPSLAGPQQRVREQCLELARKQIDQLGATVEKLNAEQQAAIRQELQRADKLAATDRAAAEQVWRGIVTLYGDKAWAEELVAEASAKLTAETEPTEGNEGQPPR